MARIRLTAAAVERLRPPKTGQAEYFDELLPSFGMRISHSGTKAWIVMTRVHGKLVRVTLGRYPALKLAPARKRAQEVISLAAEGVDPRRVEEERQLKRQRDNQNTFGSLAEEFMAKHVEPNLRPSTAREYRRILFGKDTAKWRNRPIGSITKPDVLDLLDGIDERGAKAASGLAMAYLRKFFNWCVEREIIHASPFDRVQRTRNLPSRDRVLTSDEMQLVWNAFEAEGRPFGTLFRLLLLTGQRRNEVAGMRWDELRELDTDQALWEIPSSRTKNRRVHLVPLTTQTIALIKALPVSGPYVFSTNGETPVSGFSKAKARVDHRISANAQQSKTLEISDWTLHDLRRTMVTVMNEELRVAPHVVEAVVNHLSGSAKAGVAGVYNRALYLDERLEALQRWNDWVEKTGRSDKKGSRDGNVR